MSAKDWKQYAVAVIRVEKHPVEEIMIERPAQAVKYFTEFADEAMSESLFIGHINGRNRLIGFERIYTGTSAGLSVNLYEIIRSVIASGAVGFFLLHNHPSGDPTVSDQDMQLTADCLEAANKLDLTMLDHIVVGKNGSFESVRSHQPAMWGGFANE